jgi:hypothetical protein
MKNEVQLIIFLFFAFTLLVYVFPFTFVDAAKLESGVEIIAPTTTETEKICNDTIDNDNDGKIDGDDQDCAGPKRPPAEIAEICGKGNDQDCVVAPADPTAGTCGLQIILDGGVQMNYGVLKNDQESVEQKVIIKNQGNVDAKIMIKGDEWWGLQSIPQNPNLPAGQVVTVWPTVISGPEHTKVAMSPNVNYNDKKPLSKDGSELGQISGGQSVPIYFQFKSWTQDSYDISIYSPSFHQEVSIDLLCGDNEFLKTPNTSSPLPIPYPDTNNNSGMQSRAD